MGPRPCKAQTSADSEAAADLLDAVPVGQSQGTRQQQANCVMVVMVVVQRTRCSPDRGELVGEVPEQKRARCVSVERVMGAGERGSMTRMRTDGQRRSRKSPTR